MFQPFEINRLIDFTNVTIVLTEQERQALVRLRNFRHDKLKEENEWNASWSEADLLFRGQALVPLLPATLALCDDHVPQSLVAKAHRGQVMLASIVCAEWSAIIMGIAAHARSCIDKLPPEEKDEDFRHNFIAADPGNPSPLRLTFQLAIYALQILAEEWGGKVRHADFRRGEHRNRTAATLRMFFNTDLISQANMSIAKRLAELTGDTLPSSAYPLAIACGRAKDDFIEMAHADTIRIHCPAHGVMNKLLRSEDAALLVLYHSVCRSLGIAPENDPLLVSRSAPDPARPIKNHWLDTAFASDVFDPRL